MLRVCVVHDSDLILLVFAAVYVLALHLSWASALTMRGTLALIGEVNGRGTGHWAVRA